MTEVHLRYLARDGSEAASEHAHHVALWEEGRDLVRLDPRGQRWVVTDVHLAPLGGLMGPEAVRDYASPAEAQSHLSDILNQVRCICGRQLVDTACPHCDMQIELEEDTEIPAQELHPGDVILLDEEEYEVTGRGGRDGDTVTLELDSHMQRTLPADQAVTVVE